MDDDPWADELAELLGPPAPQPQAAADAAGDAQSARPSKRPRKASSAKAKPQPKRNAVPQIPASIAKSVGSGDKYMPLLPYVQLSPPAGERKTDKQEQLDELSKWYLGRESGRQARVCSKSTLSDKTGIDRKDISQSVCRLASVAIHLDRAHRFAVERAAINYARTKKDLVCYVDFASGDETPLSVGLPGASTRASRAASCSAPVRARAISDRIESSIVPSTHTVRMTAPQKKTVSKLLQSEAAYGMLVRISKDRFVSVIGTSLCWIQLLERNTGECMQEAELRRLIIAAHVEEFETKTRLSCFDKAGANARSDNSIVANRGEGWQRVGNPCEVHICSSNQGWTLRLCERTISGQIHFALSVNFGVNLATWHRAVLDTIRARIHFTRTPPSEAAEKYRKALFRIVLSDGSRLLKKRLVLRTLPNGDLRRRDILEVYVPQGIEINEAELRESIAISTADVLAGSNLTVYPRSRWLKGDLALNEVILTEGVGGILSASYPLFAQMAGSLAIAKRSKHAKAAAMAMLPIENVPALLPLQDEAAHTPGQEQGNLSDSDGTEGAPEGLSPHEAARLENERHRKSALEWYPPGRGDR